MVNIFLVFIEGLLSFLSPCVLPLIPLYIGYLSGNAKTEKEDGTIAYNQKRVFLQTLCFTLGISVTFFLLGFAFSYLGTFLNNNKLVFSIISGVIIIILGLFQLGIINFRFMNKEKRLDNKTDLSKMNPLVAFILGFTFSFAWTPCVGPALASVYVLAAGSSSIAYSILLISVYILGFIIPFILLGIFTAAVLNFINRKKNIVKYTVKILGIVMILIGIFTIGQSIYEFNKGQGTNQGDNAYNTDDVNNSKDNQEESNSNSIKQNKAPDFELKDLNGNTHKLSDYAGKVVLINFWATWCGYCKQELPDIQELYIANNENKDNIVVLTIVNPNMADESESYIKSFAQKKGYTFPVLTDKTGKVLDNYYLSGFPLSIIVDKQGNTYKRIDGALGINYIKRYINEALDK